MGSSSSRDQKKSGGKLNSAQLFAQGIDIEDPNVAEREDEYPSPAPSAKTKNEIFTYEEEFKDSDQRVQSTPKDLWADYQSLMDYITEDIENDLVKARAILVWIASLDIGARTGQVENPDSPHGYIKKMQDGKGGYASLYATLCRQAGLVCAIIPGVSKSPSYQVGETCLDNLRNRWCALYLDGEWRLVHPLWACTSNTKPVVSDDPKIWVPVAESGSGGKSDKHDEDDSESTESDSRINEFWFLTDPQLFVMYSLPDDPDWQMLADVKSESEFEEGLYVSEQFQEYGLQISNDQKCLVAVSNGRAEIGIDVPRQLETKLAIAYQLCQKKHRGATVDMTKFICKCKTEEGWLINIRFSKAETYKLHIFGQLGKCKSWLCDFKIVCDAPDENCYPLPDQPIHGWGPTHEGEKLGLTAWSHQNSLLDIERGSSTNFLFRFQRPLEIYARLTHTELSSEDLETQISCKSTNKDANVFLRCPNDIVGDSLGLKILAKYANTSTEFEEVYGYLLRFPPNTGNASGDSDAEGGNNQDGVDNGRNDSQSRERSGSDAGDDEDDEEEKHHSQNNITDQASDNKNNKRQNNTSNRSTPRNKQNDSSNRSTNSRQNDSSNRNTPYSRQNDSSNRSTPYSRQNDSSNRSTPYSRKDDSSNRNTPDSRQNGRSTGRSSDNVTAEQEPKQYKRENGNQQLLRQRMQTATAGDDKMKLEVTIELFEKQKLEDRGDLANAKEQLEVLKLKYDLNQAIMRRHVGVLERTIKRARESDHVDQLEPDPLKSAEDLHEHLTNVDALRDPVEDLDQRTISEIRRYNHPKPIVHDIMAGVFTLLGEKKHLLTDWLYIQALLGIKGEWGVKNRIQKFDSSYVDDDEMDRTDKYLSKYDLNQARFSSNGLATFYQWAAGVMEAIHDDAGSRPNSSHPSMREKTSRNSNDQHPCDGYNSPESPTF